jgi:hypothetical protein
VDCLPRLEHITQADKLIDATAVTFRKGKFQISDVLMDVRDKT